MATVVLTTMIVAVVTPLFVANAFRVLATDWFVRHEIEREAFPSDRYGLTQEQRLRLALVGLHSIQPGGEGIRLLERATLPDGAPAFGERELRHMRDVRTLLGATFTAQIAVLILVAALALGFVRSPRWRRVVPRGLLLGSLATLVVAALAVPVILLGFDDFFLRFHQVLFDGDSWRFADSDTLLRLYPQVFWEDTARLAAAIVVGQAVLVAVISGSWLRVLSAKDRQLR